MQAITCEALDDSSGLSNRRIEKEGMYAGGVHTLLFTGGQGGRPLALVLMKISTRARYSYLWGKYLKYKILVLMCEDAVGQR